jgi:hypothetical protein
LLRCDLQKKSDPFYFLAMKLATVSGEVRAGGRDEPTGASGIQEGSGRGSSFDADEGVSNLALVLGYQGKYEQAEEMNRGALATDKDARDDAIGDIRTMKIVMSEAVRGNSSLTSLPDFFMDATHCLWPSPSVVSGDER